MMRYNRYYFPLILLLMLSACQNHEDMVIGISPGDFATALTIPEITTSTTILNAQETNSKIFKDKLSKVFGYQSGSILGKTILVNSGDSMKIQLVNSLSEATNLHWHGMIVPADMDGHPEDVVQSGSTFDYQFKVNQRAGLYWYHPHPDGNTASQAYMGLAGGVIIRDEEENVLDLPAGEFEIPLIIQDKRINADYSLDYTPVMDDIMSGYMGQYLIVNGVHSPYKEVKKSQYRLRVLNGSNSRIYNLGLSNGAGFKIIGTDGGLLATPESVSSVLLAPGERADLLMDFSSYSLGTEVFLFSNVFTGASTQGKQKFNILRFIVKENSTEQFVLPAVLSTIHKIQTASATKTRTFSISEMSMSGMSDMGNMGGMTMTGMHQINNKVYDKNRIDEEVQSGSTEIWVFDNSKGAEPHPIHIHGVQFQVIDRVGGRGKLIASEKGWKDTVLLLPGEKVRVIMTFSEYKGIFMLHCHNLEHEDDGMMLQFRVN